MTQHLRVLALAIIIFTLLVTTWVMAGFTAFISLGAAFAMLSIALLIYTNVKIKKGSLEV